MTKIPVLKRINLNGNGAIRQVCIVDGFYIRNRMNIEYCGAESRAENIEVPRRKLWLDVLLEDERDDYVRRYNGARQYNFVNDRPSDALEKVRLEQIDVSTQLRRYLKREVDPSIGSVVLGQKRLRLYIVDGFLVREYYHTGFIQGGHDKHPEFRKFIPPREIWVERKFEKEREPIILHELVERQVIRNRERDWRRRRSRPPDDEVRRRWYDLAHEVANGLEITFRRDLRMARYAKD